MSDTNTIVRSAFDKLPQSDRRSVLRNHRLIDDPVVVKPDYTRLVYVEGDKRIAYKREEFDALSPEEKSRIGKYLKIDLAQPVSE
jgi:hypothetical protein